MSEGQKNHPDPEKGRRMWSRLEGATQPSALFNSGVGRPGQSKIVLGISGEGGGKGRYREQEVRSAGKSPRQRSRKIVNLNIHVPSPRKKLKTRLTKGRGSDARRSAFDTNEVASGGRGAHTRKAEKKVQKTSRGGKGRELSATNRAFYPRALKRREKRKPSRYARQRGLQQKSPCWSKKKKGVFALDKPLHLLPRSPRLEKGVTQPWKVGRTTRKGHSEEELYLSGNDLVTGSNARHSTRKTILAKKEGEREHRPVRFADERREKTLGGPS